ncbi:MAG: hypothetical protein IPM21_08890 [Acidobacteria bacterium]|nr:hypothetical protein [Acidobacteriota bacterium]
MKRTFLAFFTLLFAISAVSAQKSEEGFDPNSTTKNEAVGNFDGQINFPAGNTRVRLSNDFVLAAQSLNIDVMSSTRIRIRRGVATFPITGATLDSETLRGEILHSSGLIFERGTAAVKIERFAIDTTGAQPLLTGLASANGSVVGRIPLFNLDLSNAQISVNGPFVSIAGVGVTLRSEAAAALNAVFETDAFVEGFNIGNANVVGFTFDF